MKYLLYSIAISCCFVYGTVQYIHANTVTQSAVVYTESSINNILVILRDKKWQTKEGQAELYPKLRAQLHDMFDFSIITSQIMGGRWQEFTPTEQEQCIQAIAELLEYTYASYFTQYSGEQVHIEHSRTNKNGNQAEVTTKVESADGKKTTMVYRLIKSDTGWKVYNVIVENINLIISYKTQLHDLLVNNTPHIVVEKLQSQARALKK